MFVDVNLKAELAAEGAPQLSQGHIKSCIGTTPGKRDEFKYEYVGRLFEDERKCHTR